MDNDFRNIIELDIVERELLTKVLSLNNAEKIPAEEIRFKNYIPRDPDFTVEKNNKYKEVKKIEKLVRGRYLRTLMNF